MAALARARILAFLCGIAITIGGPATVKELWSPILNVRTDCPRFVAIEQCHDGLGDHLERLFFSLSLVWKHRNNGITLAMSKNYGEGSIHGHNYRDTLFNVLGIPKTMSHIETVVPKYNLHLQTLKPGIYGEFAAGKRNLSEEISCNSIVSLDIYDLCDGVWCPLLWLDKINEGLGDFLHETYKLNGAYCSNQGREKYNLHETQANTINIVWHIRLLSSDSKTTHQCRACKPQYLLRVNDFIQDVINNASASASAVKNFARKDIFVHRHPTNKFSELDALLPVHVTSENLEEVLCNFATADLLVSLGSSLPATFAYFLPHDKPVIIEDYRMISERQRIGGYNGRPVPFQYITPMNRSFHLADGWPGEGVTAASVSQALMSAHEKF